MTLAFSAACRADDATAAGDHSAATGPVAPTGPDAVATRAYRHAPARRLTVAQSIDESVRRLTRDLDLDPGQQARLRQILVDQHRQVLQLRSGNAPASVDVTGTTLAIYDQSKTRIRAMLNDEQRKKYSADVPRDTLAPAQADLQHWMQIQETKRKQGGGATQCAVAGFFCTPNLLNANFEACARIDAGTVRPEWVARCWRGSREAARVRDRCNDRPA